MSREDEPYPDSNYAKEPGPDAGDFRRMNLMDTHGNVLVALEKLADAANRYPSDQRAGWALREAALGYALAILASEDRNNDMAGVVLSVYLDTLVRARGRIIPDRPKGYVNEDLLLADERCSTTMFDMHLQVNKDGRERGIWFFLNDDSEERQATFKTWLEDAVAMFCQLMKGRDGVKDNDLLKFSSWMNLHSEIGRITNAKVREAVLLEWPAVKKVHALIGKEIKKHEAKAVKTRTPRKPDRRASTRRRDDKRKAALRR